MLLQADYDPSNITTVLLSIIGLIGTGGAVKLTDIYVKYLKEKKIAANADNKAFSDSLQDRVKDLEDKIDGLVNRIEDLIKLHSDEMLAISTDKARLETEVKFLKADKKDLESDNKKLVAKVKELRNQS